MSADPSAESELRKQVDELSDKLEVSENENKQLRDRVGALLKYVPEEYPLPDEMNE